MATFRYTSLKSGSAAGGMQTLEAPDRASALRALMARGVTPSTLEEMKVGAVSASAKAGAANGASGGDGLVIEKPGSGNGSSAAAKVSGALAKKQSSDAAPVRRWGASMSLADTGSFISELATAVQAGLPLVPALRTMGKAGRKPAQRAMLDHLIAKVEQGGTLAEACRTWGKPFNELLVNLIRAGEASGRLGEVLQQTAELVERDLRLRRSLLSATLYPIILLVLVAGAIIVVTAVIVPNVLKPFQGQNIDLPWPTVVVQQFANIMGSYWWVLIGLIGAAMIGLSRARATKSGRMAIDSFMLKVPLMGALIRDAAVARFTRTLGTLVRAGLPVLTALRLTSATLGNAKMRRAMDEVCEEVAGGKTIAGPLEKSGLFPPLLVQIVSLGERSGKLPELLGQAAGSLEGRTETRVKVITTVLPPVLVVFLACVVGFVVMAILLAMLQLQDIASKA